MSGAGTFDEPDRVPLTSGQRARLLTDCMTFVVFVVIVVGFQIFWVPLVGAPNPLFYLFIVIALVVTGYDAYGRLRDLRSGVAIVCEDVLVRTGRSRRPGSGAFWGRFVGLGRMRFTSAAFRRSANGARHRVIYSPASRLVWSAEPLPSHGRAMR
jgi:hypothetical protein